MAVAQAKNLHRPECAENKTDIVNGTTVFLSVMLLLSVVNVSVAHIAGQSAIDGFFGLGESLGDNGIEVFFGVTNIYQQNIHGGLSSHRRAGRITGSYDLELSADLEKQLDFEGGSFFVHVEGGWPHIDGINGGSVGSVFGVNADAIGNRAMDVTELWYEQSMLDGTFLLRVGKMDLTGGFQCTGCPVAFDCSVFANDETSQFLNSALVNNPTIPFPVYAVGVAGFYNPMESWYVSAGVVDAQNDMRETGLRTAFHDEDYFFYIVETGVTPRLDSAKGPLQGAYRAGLWNDPQPKANSDGSKNYRDDVGFYLSCGQMLTKENDEPEDSQGLGAFFRYGCADGKKNDITDFWSVGFQYQGLVEGCDDDVLGAGFAQGFFSDSASATYTEDYESAFELYYNAQASPWLNVSPAIQYIVNPGGDKTVGDAVVLGIRVQMSF